MVAPESSEGAAGTERQINTPPDRSPEYEENTYEEEDPFGRGAIKEEIDLALESFIPTLLSRVTDTINSKLDEFVQRYPILQARDKEPERRTGDLDMNKEKERFEFKNFSNCGPPVFKGEMNPIISMRWIDKIKETFMLCECPERLKVLFAAHQMTERAQEWWELQTKAHGFQTAARFPWNTFREMFLEKFSPGAEVEKLKEEFLTIDQDEMSVSEYTGLFNDKARFCPEYTSSPKLLRDHYHRHLRPEISEFIDPLIYDDVPKMMNRALARERELHRRVSEAAGKRKVEQMSSSFSQGFGKKVKFEGRSLQSQQSQQRRPSFQQRSQQIQPYRSSQPRSQLSQQPRIEYPLCEQCGRRHIGECRYGKSCYRCLSTDHVDKDCTSPYRLCFYCYGSDHLKANCPKLREDIKKAEQRRKEAGKSTVAGGTKPKVRAFNITTEEAKESHDVVTGAGSSGTDKAIKEVVKIDRGQA